MSVNEILTEVKSLKKEDQLTLLEKLASIIRQKPESAANLKLSSISGLGSEVWQHVDIDKYLQSEREW